MGGESIHAAETPGAIAGSPQAERGDETRRSGATGEAPARAAKVPRGERRRDEIARVAETMFLNRGYAETSVQVVVAAAGASKETIYRHFGCKADLFAEVIRRRASLIIGDEGDLRGPPDAALVACASNLLDFLTRPESLRLYRVVVAEAPREPELGRIFFEQGPARTLARLAAYLAAQTAAGTLRCDDPQQASRLFLGSVICHAQISALCLGEAPGPAELQAHAREAAGLFLARYGAGGDPRDSTITA